MLVGEAPGSNEDIQGEPWVGEAGQYRDALLQRIGLTRDDVISTNVVKCRPKGNETPTLEQARFCGERWLQKEIELYKPKIIMALGKTATEYFLGEGETIEHRHGIPITLLRRGEGDTRDAEIKPANQNGMESPHGSVQRPNIHSSIGEGTILLPAYHPAAGFYDTGLMRFIQDDFAVLGKLVKGEEVERPVDDIEPVYEDQGSLQLYQAHFNPVAVDTETVDDKLWSIQLSTEPGTGWFFKPYNERPRIEGPTVVHNYMFDSRFVDLPEHTDDTMAMAYVLGLPQGLKELAWRLCGMEMKSYMETIAGHRKGKALDYLQQALLLHPDVPLTKSVREKMERKGETIELDLWANPPTIEDEKWNAKTNLYSLVRKSPQHIARKMKNILADVASGKELKDGPVDPWTRWHDVDERERAEVEDSLGPMPDASLEDIPHAEAVHYSARDPDATLRVFQVLEERIDAGGVRFAYEIDRQTLPIAREMEKNGITVNLEHLEWLSGHYAELMREKSEEIFALLKISCPRCGGLKFLSEESVCQPCHETGFWRFNPNSDKELRTLFFQHLRFTPTKLTKKTRLPSVESNELAKIKHPVVPLVEEYRHLAHLKSSFSDPLQKWADEEHKIHTTINPTRVATGRWSMKWPNLMQIPVRTELGQLVREAFTSRNPDWSLFAADYSQIEMRVAAHLSQCTSMMKLFFEGRDVHTETASEMYGKIVEKGSPERYAAKTLGFGVIYGLSPYGLHTQMQAEGIEGWSEKDCEKFIKDYYLLRPELRTWQEETLSFARLNGYVKDIFGRIRYTPEMGCPIRRYQGDGERKAINMPVQSTAQGIIKLAMVKIWGATRGERSPEWLLQIHDELIWELPDASLDNWGAFVTQIMENAVRLSVPVEVETKVGKNWREMS
jgi:DNA polymerase I-like protein with 3'-5' exonuclease and polymerase domains/uracil-DNA glycosylase